jgi:putative acetyltransferase
MGETTENIVVRRAEPEDAEAAYEIHRGLEIARFTYQLPYPSAALWRSRLADVSPGTIRLVAEVNESAVGFLAIHMHPDNPRRKHAASLGMAVAEAWQGRGVGSALMNAAVSLADEWLNLTRLELEVYATNPSALKLYEKFGFEIEGTLREYAFTEGRLVDAYTMARIRPRT